MIGLALEIEGTAITIELNPKYIETISWTLRFD